MMTFSTILGVCMILFVIIQGIVQIIKVSKSTGSRAAKQTIRDLETDRAKVEEDMEELRQRIIVLEKIITDDKYNLHREIDDLANG